MPKKRIDRHWVLIDLEKLGKTTETPQIVGSISKLVKLRTIKDTVDRKEGDRIISEEKLLNYDQLRERLNKNETQRYWKNKRFIIKECIVERSERKK